MFTGLVEEVGTVTCVEHVSHGLRLRIATAVGAQSLVLGDSIAVDGACLTVVEIDGMDFLAEVSPETIARTNQSFYEEGTKVNLERPLAVNDRIGGHFVQGHVDAVTRQRFQREEGDFVLVRFEMPVGLERYLVSKGSIAINGVSLTIADLDQGWFDVQLVPHTLEQTNLISNKRAEAMNVEVDILGKYVARMLEGHLQVPLVESMVVITGDET
jgi:riboflavin synthase